MSSQDESSSEGEICSAVENLAVVHKLQKAADAAAVAFRPSLIELRERLAQKLGAHSAVGPSAGATPSLSEGVPRGVICEVTGTARTEWVVGVLAQNPRMLTFWAEPELSVLPTALHQRGVDLSRVLMAETGDRLFQVVRRALKSRIFDGVVLPGSMFSGSSTVAVRDSDRIRMLKALQLFARESHAWVALISSFPQSAWAIPLQLRVDWEEGGRTYRTQILKTKLALKAP